MIKQVGGNHYAAEYQHWDWAAETALGYLESAATKYVSRWWKKNGIQDLEKGLSYLLKLQLVADAVPELVPAGERPLADEEKLRRFLNLADIPDREARVIDLVDGWTRENGQLSLAIATLTDMVDVMGVERDAADPTGHPAPFGYEGEG